MTNFTTMLALRIIARTPRSWLTITAMPRGLGLSQGRLHLAAQRLGHLGRLEAARGEARDAHLGARQHLVFAPDLLRARATHPAARLELHAHCDRVVEARGLDEVDRNRSHHQHDAVVARKRLVVEA